jgi:hypothetical protein
MDDLLMAGLNVTPVFPSGTNEAFDDVALVRRDADELGTDSEVRVIRGLHDATDFYLGSQRIARERD